MAGGCIDLDLLRQMSAGQKACLVCVSAGIVGSFILGFGLSYAWSYSSLNTLATLNHDSYLSDTHITDYILDQIQIGSLKDSLRYFSEEPHSSGSDRDREIRRELYKIFERELDSASETSYRINVTLPTRGRPNKVELLNDNQVTYDSSDNNDGGNPTPFVAFSPNEEVEGQEVVYANFGTDEDFKLVEEEVAINDLVILRLGGGISIFEKVANAAKYNAKGVILYPDPEQFAKGEKYPSDWWLPDTAVPFGTSLNGHGDPQTPGWPSLKSSFKLNLEDLSNSLPQIPVQTVSAAFAKYLMSNLGGKDPLDGFKGGFENVDYNLGGNFQSNVDQVTLTVNNQRKTQDIINIMGTIQGSVEPDRYVIVGNHRDSWSFGAAKPSSATAALIEVIMAFNRTMENLSYRPRRTIIFASWDGGEYGNIGANEFFEENLPNIRDKAVAYISSDMCVSGPDFAATSSPSLKQVLIEAMKAIEYPNIGGRYTRRRTDKTYYHYWQESNQRRCRDQSHQEYQHHIEDLTGETDASIFAFKGGIPSVNIRFNNATDEVSMLPAVNTQYDNFKAYEDFIDPKMTYLRTCSRFLAHSVRQMADSAILPHNFRDYKFKIIQGLRDWKDDDRMKNISLISKASITFNQEVQKWDDNYDQILGMARKNPVTARWLNDQIMRFESIFVTNTHDNQMRNILFGPTRSNLLGSVIFPVVHELIHELDRLPKSQDNEEEREKIQTKLEKHLFDLMTIIYQAAAHLNATNSFQI